MRRVSRLRAAIVVIPLLSILAAPVAMAADAKERVRLPQKVKRLVITIMEQLGIPPG